MDYFKQYNNIYGHLEGDNCLRKIADVAESTLHEDDLGIRFGGDEFLIIRVNCDKQTAKKLSLEIEQKVKKLAISHIASQAAESNRVTKCDILNSI